MTEEHNAEPGHERWLVSFADFMTLLFALFAVLYATSNQDLEKTKQFQDSIRRYLMKAGAGLGVAGSGDKNSSGERFSNPIEPPIQTYNAASPLSQEVFDEAERFVEESLKEVDQKKYVLDVQRDPLGVRMTLSGQALFANNSAKFRPEAMAFIDQLGELLTKVGRKVMVEGHLNPGTNNNASFASDWEFSGARATSLVRYLIKRHQMDGANFVPVAYGSSRPLSNGRTENDRIEVILMTEDLPL